MDDLTDNQLLNRLEIERDRLRRYEEAANGDPCGYRVPEIREDVRALQVEALRRGLE